jgi:AbrB family looped-hinge helix DNA binding protein
VVVMNDKIGVMKEIDSLGRLVIPKEIRETFKLDKCVEIIITKEGILLRNPKYEIVEKNETEAK